MNKKIGVFGYQLSKSLKHLRIKVHSTGILSIMELIYTYVVVIFLLIGNLHVTNQGEFVNKRMIEYRVGQKKQATLKSCHSESFYPILLVFF